MSVSPVIERHATHNRENESYSTSDQYSDQQTRIELLMQKLLVDNQDLKKQNSTYIAKIDELEVQNATIKEYLSIVCQDNKELKIRAENAEKSLISIGDSNKELIISNETAKEEMRKDILKLASQNRELANQNIEIKKLCKDGKDKIDTALMKIDNVMNMTLADKVKIVIYPNHLENVMNRGIDNEKAKKINQRLLTQ